MKIVVWCREVSRATKPCCQSPEDAPCGKFCLPMQNYLRDHG